MNNMNKGFTLIELVIVVSIISILYGIVLFSVSQYINKGKDSNIYGNLAVLIPAGEVFYNGNNSSYIGFCDPSTPNGNSILRNTVSQMPQNYAGTCYGGVLADPTTWRFDSNPAGLCCSVDPTGQAWAAYAQEFANPSNIYCVDSRGMKEETSSDNIPSIKSYFQCP